jgi:CheY-like chemotaxis protein
MAPREVRESPAALKVLVLDNSPDILELLATDLKCRGCAVTTGSVSAIRHGDIDGVAFIERSAPDVVVFDVAVPYEINWRVAIDLQADPRVRIPFVLTTTNATAVRRLIGCDLIELVGKPYDLDTLYDVILRSVSPNGGDAVSSPADRETDRRSGVDRRSAAHRQAVDVESEIL